MTAAMQGEAVCFRYLAVRAALSTFAGDLEIENKLESMLLNTVEKRKDQGADTHKSLFHCTPFCATSCPCPNDGMRRFVILTLKTRIFVLREIKPLHRATWTWNLLSGTSKG